MIFSKRVLECDELFSNNTFLKATIVTLCIVEKANQNRADERCTFY